MDITKPCFGAAEDEAAANIRAQIQLFRKQAHKPPDSDAANVIRAQIQLFRKQANEAPKSEAVVVPAQIQRFRKPPKACLPPITEAVDFGNQGPPPAAAKCDGGGFGPKRDCDGGGVGAKSDCVKRIEEMQRQRDARRKAAAEAKVRRAGEVAAAKDVGGIESVEFLQMIREYRQKHGVPDRPQPWAGEHIWSEPSGAIRVCVRKRPMAEAELRRHDFDVVSTEGHDALAVHEPRTRVDMGKAVDTHRFRFDAIFNERDGNGAIHAAAVAPLLPHVLDGGHATVFALCAVAARPRPSTPPPPRSATSRRGSDGQLARARRLIRPFRPPDGPGAVCATSDLQLLALPTDPRPSRARPSRRA